EADAATAAYDPAVPPHGRHGGKQAAHPWRAGQAAGGVVPGEGENGFVGGRGPMGGGGGYGEFGMGGPVGGRGVCRVEDGTEEPGFDPAWGHSVTDGR